MSEKQSCERCGSTQVAVLEPTPTGGFLPYEPDHGSELGCEDCGHFTALPTTQEDGEP